LTIPVSGIPITITRTYDSRNRTTGDFGAGWTLDIKDIELQESVVLGTAWEQTANPGLLTRFNLKPTRPHFVIVRFPDGRLDVFDMAVTPFLSYKRPRSLLFYAGGVARFRKFDRIGLAS
jgi:hypothetical protein